MAVLGSSSNTRCLLSSGSSLSHPLLCARACRGEFLRLSCRQLQQSHKLLGLNWGSDNRRQQEEERGALTSDRQQFSSTSIRRRRYCSFLAPCCCSSAPTEASVSNGKHKTPPPPPMVVAWSFLTIVDIFFKEFVFGGFYYGFFNLLCHRVWNITATIVTSLRPEGNTPACNAHGPDQTQEPRVSTDRNN